VAFGGALVRPDLSTLGPWWTAPGLLLSLMITAIVPWLWGWVALAGVRLCRRVSDPRGDAARRQAVERQAASVRLADAFAADRRRIERDLHDGAQQRIVAQSLTLGRAAAALDPGTGAADPARARDLVAHALDENRAILADLRALVRSISPRVLLDRGVGAAVAEVAARAGLPVEVDVRLPERLPALVEQTAYFVVLEALTNATKHADATGVRVRVTRAEDELLLEVRDDGAGGARIVEDGGLAGLIDRVRGIGGTVHLTSPPGSGTRVSARLPLVLPRTARTELARWSA
jgi:signal transduction histidine kinase